jgi:DMSO/TMAO reductase YedYZ molybdopterin-dependent catalytic subunit
VTAARTRRLAIGAAAGLLSAAAGVGASVLAAALVGGAPTPITAVGERVIDASPGALKDWAIRTFGSSDKPVLLAGIFTVLGLLACCTGIAAWRSRPVALAVTTLLGLIGLAAAYADRTSVVGTTARIIPALTALAVSVGMLAWFTESWYAWRAPSNDRPRPTTDPSSASTVRVATGYPSGQPAPPAFARGSTAPAPAPPGFDRRAFLAAALVSGAVATTGFGSSRLFSNAGTTSRNGIRLPRATSPAPALSPGATLQVAGLTPYITDSEDFYRVDTALTVPQIAAADWKLRISGQVGSELQLTYSELLDMPLIERRVTLTCVSNEVGGDLAGNATWLGVRISDLLERVGVRGGADAVKSTSADGFTVGTPLAALTDGRDAMIAIGMNGKPLPIDHGFPARMVVPGLYGYVSATKWLVDMEITRFADFSAYWTDRGWAEKGPIKIASRIDVPTGFAQLRAGKVAVAGVAWAQHTGIASVDVRIDGGAWQQARLAELDTIDSWRQWVYEWDAPAGSHILEVRATDKTGTTQTSRRVPPRPDGATGWHTVSVRVA